MQNIENYEGTSNDGLDISTVKQIDSKLVEELVIKW